ncbi:MAG: hypothetical protein MSA65_03680 [Mollicutes bacterium]|nr:hypothetical protein [Mollicutes bacterium]
MNNFKQISFNQNNLSNNLNLKISNSSNSNFIMKEDNSNFSNLNTYYILIKPDKTVQYTYTQDFNIYLVDYNNNDIKNRQLIGKITAYQLNNNNFVSFIFSPIANGINLNAIQFEQNGNDILNNVSVSISIIYNQVLSNERWEHIGVQGMPNNLIMVNNELFSLGKSGVLEIGNEIKNNITKFAIIDHGNNNILVDILYKEV